MFTKLDDLSKERTRLIIEDAAKDTRTAKSARPMPAISIRRQSKRRVSRRSSRGSTRSGGRQQGGPVGQLCEGDRMGIASRSAAYVGQDDKDPDTLYLTRCSRAASACPTVIIILLKDAQDGGASAAHICRASGQVLTLAGRSRMPPPAPRRSSISRPADRRRPLDAVEDPRRDQDLQQDDARRSSTRRAPGFDFRQFMAASAPKINEVLVAQPSALTGIAKQIVPKRRSACSRTSCWSAARRLCGLCCPMRSTQEAFAFYGTDAVRARREQEARWKRGVELHRRRARPTRSAKLYVRAIFPGRNQGGWTCWSTMSLAAMGRRIDKLDLDAAGDQGQGPRQARQFHHQDRLSRPVAAIIRSSRSKRDDLFGNAIALNQWAFDDNMSASSADRSAAGNGA